MCPEISKCGYYAPLRLPNDNVAAELNASVMTMHRFEIHLAETDSDKFETFDVMRELRPHLNPDEYLALVKQLESEVGYRLASLKESGSTLCVAGFRFCRSLGWGKYLYVDDLVTRESARSTGAGKAMFEWLTAYANEHGCDELRLDSAVYRHGAHRFYLRERMDIACFNFKLDLRPVEAATPGQKSHRTV